MIQHQHYPEFIHLEQCNFVDYPPGGTLSFSRQIRKSFGSKVALAGIVTDNTPCGTWIEKEIEGTRHSFFGIGRISPKSKKPVIPLRIQTYFFLKRSLSKLSRINTGRIFTSTPQFMLTLDRKNWESICFCFAGTGNAVALSRYPLLRCFGNYYEKTLFKSLRRNADCILASADKNSINKTIKRSGGRLEGKVIHTFPTRYDDQVFYHQNRDECRLRLGLPLNSVIISVNGRLSWVKGWPFIIQTLKVFMESYPDAKVIFIGDGEDRQVIESKHSDMIEKKSIIITGQISPEKVNEFLGASDIIMVGSYEEGWSMAMVEALACGKPILSTHISGSEDMVLPGKNGEILTDRDPQKAAEAIKRILKQKNASAKSIELSKLYRLDSLTNDLKKLWVMPPDGTRDASS